jgi:hypothetical protein
MIVINSLKIKLIVIYCVLETLLISDFLLVITN